MTERGKRLRTLSMAVAVFVACLVAPSARAKVVVVGTCLTGFTTYTTIQAAVNGIPAGTSTTSNVIDICPGTYPEQVLITKNYITLIGLQNGTQFAAVVTSPAGGMVSNGTDIYGNAIATQIFVQNALGVKIQRLIVDGTGNNLTTCNSPVLEGIYYQNSTGTITQNVVRNQLQDPADQGCESGLAINIESSTGTPAVTISSNSVHSYQKNGITADGTGAGTGGPNATITGNYVVGLGPTQGVSENGIQIGLGASGSISSNTMVGSIWSPDMGNDPLDAATGIILYASGGITITQNTVSSTQFGIGVYSDPLFGNADSNTITINKVSGTQVFDAIDLCSNSNTVQTNTIYYATESGIHSDTSSSCTQGGTVVTGMNNTVTNNTINEACAGILEGTTGTGTFSPDTYFNVTNTTMAGDSCPAGGAMRAARSSGEQRVMRPRPYLPRTKK